jgi:isocitrate/isopropylmalate dehydrogenase
MPLNFKHFDLSLENRRDTNNQVVHDAGAAMKQTGLGLKAATITPGDPDDVGSPNALLREILDAQVILRTGRRIPKVRPIAGVHSPISVVRMAQDDAYGAEERREGEGLSEIAYQIRHIERRVCRVVAEFAFRHAALTNAKVFGGPKFTVSPVYEGMFKEELDAAALRHPSVRYDPQLIDATYALLLETTGEPLVIPTLNRDGDVMSDLVLKMFGSIAGAESLVLNFDDDLEVSVVMAEAPHGTAPSLQGKNVANPMAMILAEAALMSYINEDSAKRASRAIREATLEAVHQGNLTADLGGASSTSDFTDEVIRRVVAKLEVWETM